jgi:hypothetical protein
MYVNSKKDPGLEVWKPEFQSSRNLGSNDHVLAPVKNVVPLPFKVSSADPQTTIYNGHVLNDRDREISIPCTRGGGRSVIFAASLQSVCKARHDYASSWLEGSRYVLTRQLDTICLSGNNRHSSGQVSFKTPFQWQPISRATFTACQAGLYSKSSILGISDGHKSQSGCAYTHHCLRSSRVRPIRYTLAKALPASLNGRRMETCRDKHHHTAIPPSAVDLVAENRQTDVQMTTIEDDVWICDFAILFAHSWMTLE